jgi:hypothetical protein
MKIDRKLELLVQHVRSIARHDDAPQDEVETALAMAKEMIDAEVEALRARRAAVAETTKAALTRAVEGA